MDQNFLDLISHIQDEIALEGLDGITLQALWLRLSLRNDFPMTLPLDECSKSLLWTFIINDEEMTFYHLEKPRSDLKIFNRYECIDSEMGMVLEPEEEIEDIYPCCPVDDEVMGLRGSCSTYKTSEDISYIVTSLTLDEAETQFGNSLVIVASQLLRNKALGINAAVDKFYDLTLMQYLLLERIARSRTMGEITFGKNSLACLKTGPKSLFYHRKRLLKMNLITKQEHQQRSHKGQMISSSLLQLTRFHVIRRSKFVMMVHKIAEILKEKPNFWHPIHDVKVQLGLSDISGKKMFKNSEFLKYVRVILVPYRQVFKNASEAEWKFKLKDEEKLIRCFQLINPDLRIEDMFVSKEDEADFGGAGEEGEDETSSGILDQSRLLLGVSLMRQAYMGIEGAGPDGLSQNELAKLLGQTKLDARTICRNLQRRNVIYSLMKDFGKQRVTRYVSNKFASTGHLLQEFETERKRMMEAAGNTAACNNDSDTAVVVSEEPLTTVVLDSENGNCDIEVSLEIRYQGSNTSVTVSDEDSVLIENSPQKNNEYVEGIPPQISNNFTCSLPNVSFTNAKKPFPYQTARVFKRGTIILNEVKRQKIIEDIVRLQKLITEIEFQEGCDMKMDKKSLTRLLDKLSKEGYLKIVWVKFRCESRERCVTLVVDPSVSLSSRLFKSAVERQRHKFFAHIVAASKRNSSNLTDPLAQPSSEVIVPEAAEVNLVEEPTVGASMMELRKMHTVPAGTKLLGKEDEDLINKLVGVKGAVGPKFLRLQEFHKLLFYLIYGYEGDENPDQEEMWISITNSSPEDMSTEDLSSYPPVYVPELSWKMFVPPLPLHSCEQSAGESMDGWCFLVDILLRIPLCIFMKIVYVVCNYSLLNSYLNHPIKRYLLIKHLPPELRKVLLHGRRYVTYIVQLCQRLCYIGLAQHGKHVMKEKDQIFLYVNRYAALVDTTTSDPGYHHISTDREYVCKKYKFETLEDVVQYWYDMWTICMHTPLGGHSCVEGKSVTVMQLEKKPEMIETLTVRTITDAQLRDIGFIPGDGRGAAGLDSALYAHLKRNWSSPNVQLSSSLPSMGREENEKTADGGKIFSYTQYLQETCDPSNAENSNSNPQLPGIRNVRLSLYKPCKKEVLYDPISVSVGLVDSTSGLKNGKKTPYSALTNSTKLLLKRKGIMQRQFSVRKKSTRKPYYDEEDRAALRRMNKLRVDWYPAEDSVLLLCKIASVYLLPNKRQQIINFSVIRDILHSRYPESRNKTSRACQRRINYMLKNPTTQENLAVLLEELKQDSELTKEFTPHYIRMNRYEVVKEFTKMFKSLVERLISKFTSHSSKKCPDLPNTLQEFDQHFRIIRTAASLREGPKIKAISSTKDIDHYVIHTLLISSLCSLQDRESWAYQLYLVYQKYPQSLLNSVLNSIRESKMISYKKTYNRSSYSRHCLPLSTSPFQLSHSYIHTFRMRYQYDIFGHCWDMVKKLVAAKEKTLADLEEQIRKTHTTSLSLEKPLRKRGRKRKRIKKELDASTDVEGNGNAVIDADDDTHAENAMDDAAQNILNPLQKRLIDEKGVEVIINHEGGFCASVVSLMATKRLVFDIIIPEQIIMIKKQDTDKECRTKLLKKIQHHEEMSGRRFVLPPELQRTERENSPNDEDNSTDSHQQSATADSTQPADTSEDNSNNPVEAVSPSGHSATEPIIVDTHNSVNSSSLQTDDSFCSDSETVVASQQTQNAVVDAQAANPDEQHDIDDVTCNSELLINESTLNEDSADDVSLDGSRESTEDPLLITSDAPNQKCSTDKGDNTTKRKLLNLSSENPKKKTKLFVEEETSPDMSVPAKDGTSKICTELTDAENSINIKGIKKSSRSRLTMYMLREQLVSDYESVYPQWESDNVLINTCEVSCRLRLPPETEYDPLLLSSSGGVARVFLPLCQDKINSALAKRKKIVLGEWMRISDALDLLESRGEPRAYIEEAEKLYHFIDSFKDSGASAQSIKSVFGERATYHPMKIVADLEELILILKVGVDTWKWVTVPHSRPWLIHTNKISRSKMKSMAPVRETGVYEVRAVDEDKQAEEQRDAEPDIAKDLEEEPQKKLVALDGNKEGSTPMEVMKGDDAGQTKDSEENRQQDFDAMHTASSPVIVEDEAEKVGALQNVRSKLALKNPRYRKNTESMASVEREIIAESTQLEELDVLVRPWGRLNGCLNRRVIDRFLGSVLCYVMEHPGISGRMITNKFWPALQPAHTYELLETLEQIDCISRSHIIKSHKISLFSSPQNIEQEPVESFDFDEDYVYSASVDAVLKLSMFIGDKKYTQEFLSILKMKV